MYKNEKLITVWCKTEKMNIHEDVPILEPVDDVMETDNAGEQSTPRSRTSKWRDRKRL